MIQTKNSAQITQSNTNWKTLPDNNFRSDMNWKELKIFSFMNNKGGVSKTTLTLLTAQFLGMVGFNVLVIDTDYNNSTSYKLLSDDDFITAETKNVYEMISHETNNPEDYAISTKFNNVSVIPSSRYLSDLGTISENRLLTNFKNLTGKYDVIIIDAKPDYNKISENIIKATDKIIIPVFKNLDSDNAAQFMINKISMDHPNCLDKVSVEVIGYNHRFDNATKGRQVEYISLFQSKYNLTPVDSWMPWTTDVTKLKDEDLFLTFKTGIPKCVINAKLFEATYNLCRFMTERDFIRPDYF